MDETNTTTSRRLLTALLTALLMFCFASIGQAQEVIFEEGKKAMNGNVTNGKKKILFGSPSKKILITDFIVEFPFVLYRGKEAAGRGPMNLSTSAGVMGTMANFTEEDARRISDQVFAAFKEHMEGKGFEVKTYTPDLARKSKGFSKKEKKGTAWIVQGESEKVEKKRPDYKSFKTRPSNAVIPVMKNKLLYLLPYQYAYEAVGNEYVYASIHLRLDFLSFTAKASRISAKVEASSNIDLGNTETVVNFTYSKDAYKMGTYTVRPEGPVYVDDASFILDTETKKRNILGAKRTYNTFVVDVDKYAVLAQKASVAFLEKAFEKFNDFKSQ